MDRGSGTEMVGVRLFGPAPLGRVFFRFARGVSVLYGRNGAGKSTLLRSLAQAADPRTDPEAPTGGVHVVLRVAPDFRTESPERLGLSAEVLEGLGLEDRALGAVVVPDLTWAIWSLFGAGLGIASESPEDSLRRWMVEHSEAEAEPLVDEIVGQHLFVVTCEAAEKWLWVGARVTEDTPGLREVWRRSGELIRSGDLMTGENVVILGADDSDNDEGGESRRREDIGRDLRWLGRRWSDPTQPAGFTDPPLGMQGAADEALGLDPPPAWFAEPIVPVARLALEGLEGVDGIEFALGSVLTEQHADLTELTVQHLMYQAQYWPEGGGSFRAGGDRRALLAATDDGKVTVDPEVLAAVTAVSAEATEIAADLLLDAPVLHCRVHHPEAWAHGPAVTWEAYDTPSGTWVALDQLSQAQHRWAVLAIQSAVAPPPQVILLDEPESALHPQAVRHLVIGLKRLSERFGTAVVVASHSPELLRDPQLVLHHVSRDSHGRTQVTPMPSSLRDNLDSLGLDPSDLLQQTRLFLLVEGRHDEIVLNTLLGDELAAARVTVLPIRGGRQLASTVDSQLIFDFTQATVVALLDNLAAERISLIWDRALDIANGQSADAAVAFVLKDMNGKTAEEKFLREFCVKALRQSAAHRITVLGLEKGDIIEYLDCPTLVPGQTSWARLRHEHQHHAGQAFKAWLEQAHRASFTDQQVEAAALALDTIPDDLSDLLQRCQRLTATPRRSTHPTQ